MKKVIVHVIFNLGRGGAETMLVAVIKELTEYDHIIVTLQDENHFGDELVCNQLICLHAETMISIPLATFKLNRLIRKYSPCLVHTHLFWPTVIARIATPKKTPLLTTIHSFIATSLEYKHRHIRWIDKLTYRFRKSIIIAVAKGAMKEYFSFLKLEPYKAYTLYTFVDTRIFNDGLVRSAVTDSFFRLISVGALREQKNHRYLIEAFKQLREEGYLLDIYGMGPLQQELEKLLQQNNITAIKLKGQVKDINTIIPQYDLVVMSSTFEGFSLGVLEAMALKKPLLLSDIESFREQCESAAVYFDLNDPKDFVNKLKKISADGSLLKQLGENGKQRVSDHFTLQHHMEGLRGIYADALNEQ
jgi:glycosyltransferase involved in cell wall biosynthesis